MITEWNIVLGIIIDNKYNRLENKKLSLLITL